MNKDKDNNAFGYTLFLFSHSFLSSIKKQLNNEVVSVWSKIRILS